MSIVTRNAKLASGNVAINIQTSGSAVFADLLDISSIRFEYDLVPNAQDVTSLQAIPGSVSIKLSDDLSNGGSLYDALESAIGTPIVSGANSNGYANANVLLYAETLDASSNYSFAFLLTFQNVQFDDKDKTVSLKLAPPKIQNRLVPDFFTSSTNVNLNVQDITNGVDYVYNVTLAGDYINTYISNLNPQAQTNQIRFTPTTSYSLGTIFRTKLTTISNTNLFVITEDRASSNQWNAGELPTRYADELVSRLAVSSGYIYGSAFNVNFFVNRLDRFNGITLSEDDVTDVKFAQTLAESIKTINVNVNIATYFATNNQPPYIYRNNEFVSNAIFTGPPGDFPGKFLSFDGSNLFMYNPIGSQTIGLSPQLAPYAITTSYNPAGGGLATRSAVFVGENTTAIKDLTDAGQKSYARATGADAYYNKILRVDTEILGFDKIKPHQTMNFDSSLDSRFQGRNFRPTTLEYDLKNDRVRVSAYEI